MTIGMSIALALIILLIIFSQFLIFSSDPFSGLPFSSFLNSVWVFNSLRVVVVPIFSIIDPEVKNSKFSHFEIFTFFVVTREDYSLSFSFNFLL